MADPQKRLLQPKSRAVSVVGFGFVRSRGSGDDATHPPDEGHHIDPYAWGGAAMLLSGQQPAYCLRSRQRYHPRGMCHASGWMRLVLAPDRWVELGAS